MKKMRRVAALALSAAMVASMVTGCGSDSTSTDTSSDTSSSDTAADDTAADDTAADDTAADDTAADTAGPTANTEQGSTARSCREG